MSKVNRKTKNEKLKIEDVVMGKVKRGEIKMKPKWYFFLGSISTLLGVVSLTVGAIFLTNLTIFLIRKRGPGYGRLSMVLESFPIWIPVLAVVGIVMGIWLLKKYDFSYKKNFLYVAILFLLSIIVAGIIVDKAGLNDAWSQHGPMRGVYRRYINHKNVLPWHEQGRRRLRPQ